MCPCHICRYYNKETGPLGAAYEKKTDMAMCDELGPKGDHYLDDFIMEKGKTSLCKATEPFTGCTDKEKTFIGKVESSTRCFPSAISLTLPRCPPR